MVLEVEVAVTKVLEEAEVEVVVALKGLPKGSELASQAKQHRKFGLLLSKHRASTLACQHTVILFAT